MEVHLISYIKHLRDLERLRLYVEYLGDSSSKYAIQKKYSLSSVLS